MLTSPAVCRPPRRRAPAPSGPARPRPLTRPDDRGPDVGSSSRTAARPCAPRETTPLSHLPPGRCGKRPVPDAAPSPRGSGATCPPVRGQDHQTTHAMRPPPLRGMGDLPPHTGAGPQDHKQSQPRTRHSRPVKRGGVRRSGCRGGSGTGGARERALSERWRARPRREAGAKPGACPGRHP